MNWLKRLFDQKRSQQVAAPPETVPSYSAASKKTTAGTKQARTKSSGKSKTSAGKKRTSEPVRVQHSDQEIASLISMLGRGSLDGRPPHWHKLLKLGDRAIPHLLPLLDLPLQNDRNDLTANSPGLQNNVMIVAEAAKLLGHLGAKQAIPKLKALSSNTQWYEVQRDSKAALAELDSKSGTELQLDYDNPYQQIANLWTAIFQGQRMLYPADVLHSWSAETIAAMPNLAIPKAKKDRAWSMLGSLYYKSIHPDWSGDPDSVEPCPEAKKCFQAAILLDSSQSHWNKLAKKL